MATTIDLINGTKMPVVGLGTWQATNPVELEKALDVALSAGYRHIDTAYMYQNEEVIGKVLKRWLDSGKIKREELYIVTKLPPIGMRKEHVGYFLEKQLKSLQLDYVDLYLVHMAIGFQYVDDKNLFPTDEDGSIKYDSRTNHAEIWKAMEQQVDKGLTKSIGISNFSSDQIERLMKVARIQPANHQIELHAYCQRKPVRETCKKYNITICAYAPIGSPGRKELYKKRGADWEPIPILEDPVVTEIAKAHGKSTSQVLLRFLTQQGIAVIPKSTNPDRLKSNFDVFDFTLTSAEMKKLDSLDQGEAGRSFKVTGLWKGLSAHPEFRETYG